jgi:hypothetical protein
MHERKNDMRALLIILALTVSVAMPRAASAEYRSSARPAVMIAEPSLTSRLPTLFRKLGVQLIPSAHAAECTRQGEICSSNEQCCPGLECSGGPPATCEEED